MVIFVVCGIWLEALGVYFAVLRPPLLPEGLRFIWRSPDAVEAARAPGLAGTTYATRLFTLRKV